MATLPDIALGYCPRTAPTLEMQRCCDHFREIPRKSIAVKGQARHRASDARWRAAAEDGFVTHFVYYDLPPDVKDKIPDLRWQMAGNRMMLAFYRLEFLLRKADRNRTNVDRNQFELRGAAPIGRR